jgi:hypothetical protein
VKAYRNVKQGTDGAAAVEFALIVPLLILLLFGITQFGLTFIRYQGVQSAAREGARIASLSQTTDSMIRARVCDSYDGSQCSGGGLAGVPIAAAPIVSVIPAQDRPCNFRMGQPVIVEVSVQSAIDIPLWGAQTVTLRGTGEFRCE